MERVPPISGQPELGLLSYKPRQPSLGRVAVVPFYPNRHGKTENVDRDNQRHKVTSLRGSGRPPTVMAAPFPTFILPHSTSKVNVARQKPTRKGGLLCLTNDLGVVIIKERAPPISGQPKFRSSV